MTFGVTHLIGFGGGGGQVSVAGYAITTTPVGSTSLTINLPSSIGTNDLLLVFLALDGNGRIGVNVPTGFTLIGSVQSMDAGGELAGFYKVATGSEGGTVAMTISSSSDGGTVALRVTGYRGTPENSGSALLDPASLTPSWGSAATLWIAFLGLRFPAGVSTITWPTNYGVPQVASNADFHANAAWRVATGTSENPSAFVTDGSPNFGTLTVGIRPA